MSLPFVLFGACYTMTIPRRQHKTAGGMGFPLKFETASIVEKRGIKRFEEFNSDYYTPENSDLKPQF
jgi:hypothetical protein